jgi:hypothetical protein
LNCRKVSSLLSAYMDEELVGSEAQKIRSHMELCSLCRAEYQSLRETKRLLNSLALQTPRAELEELLQIQVVRRTNPLARIVPAWVSDWIAYQSAFPVEVNPNSRVRARVATALLSVVGLCLATASLNSTRDEATTIVDTPELMPSYTGASLVEVRPIERIPVLRVAPVSPAPSPYNWRGISAAAITPASLPQPHLNPAPVWASGASTFVSPNRGMMSVSYALR